MKEDLGRCSGLLLIALCGSNKSHKGNSQAPTGKERGTIHEKAHLFTLAFCWRWPAFFGVASAQTN
jgi:hypothetical protein